LQDCLDRLQPNFHRHEHADPAETEKSGQDCDGAISRKSRLRKAGREISEGFGRRRRGQRRQRGTSSIKPFTSVIHSCSLNKRVCPSLPSRN
jgi:hypothetical protein